MLTIKKNCLHKNQPSLVTIAEIILQIARAFLFSDKVGATGHVAICLYTGNASFSDYDDAHRSESLHGHV